MFLVGLIAIHAALRQAYYAFITPQDSYLRRQEAFSAHQELYDVALFGDSYALAGVVPELLGNAANLSQLGEGYIVRYYKLRYNLRKSPGKIKTIILPLDLHSFSPAWGEDFVRVGSSRYVNFADYIQHTGLTEKALKSFAHYYLFPYADCTQEIYQVLPASQKAKRQKDIARLVRSLADTGATEKQIQQMMTIHYGEEREWLSQKSLLYFNRIKSLCQEHDIRVVFVRFPVSRRHFEAASKIVPVDEFDSFTQELVDDWPGAVLLDYRELYFGRDDLFSDLNHLNANGAAFFSQQLREDLVRLGVLTPRLETPVS
ncbi:MAG: hypothetical protein U9Q79_00310 [Candidatus Hydrogenedentes bacterium]|nr:hypothetical protein [Candidatus Hydrogenedentota bacterium]